MANVVRKAFRYLSKRAEVAFEEKARPEIQLEQAMDEARGQHERLVSQAALVVGNQRHIEMKLGRKIEEVADLTESARSALTLADNSRAAGDPAAAGRYEQTAQAFASRLIAAEAALEDLKVLQRQAAESAAQARTAVEENTLRMQRLAAERTRLLTQIEHAAMHEQMGRVMEQMSSLPPVGDVPTLADVRDKVEKRYATALGRQELASQGLEAQMIEVRRATMDAQAQGRLAELRAGLQSGHSSPARPAVPSGQGAPAGEGVPAGEDPSVAARGGAAALDHPGGTGERRPSLEKAPGDTPSSQDDGSGRPATGPQAPPR
ncbi:phage shock protein A (IM30), suppresses sigma54-dependent transcription [Frankia sp. EI5c]|uniref:PspA/IM30 family protein n=1 Tax=Frankia sp. EI5c TaxID=683316 RepID=UPI0007C345DE|nr:PspA/IM30 family protein [Frankia sp. EI5c]OAA24761.1 phage shock protein A (IM30), suppresses sigma54-dependent transcription [Frankia sp. EI5c]